MIETDEKENIMDKIIGKFFIAVFIIEITVSLVVGIGLGYIILQILKGFLQ
jgi:hypothetical protein